MRVSDLYLLKEPKKNKVARVFFLIVLFVTKPIRVFIILRGDLPLDLGGHLLVSYLDFLKFV